MTPVPLFRYWRSNAAPPEPDRTYRVDEGSIVVLTAVCLIPLVFSLAIVVDSGRVWAERATLQNGVEAAAAAGASAWIRTGSVCPTSVRSLLTVDGASPDQVTCTTTGTSRGGSLTLSARDAAPLAFAQVLGRSSATISAATTVRIGSAGSLVGIWPVALCEQHPSLLEWKNSGFTLTSSYTITVAAGPVHCSGGNGGNWGLLDFNGGSNPTSEASDWVQNGYQSPLKVGDLIPGNPGGVSGSIGIETMRGKRVLIALYDQVQGSGSSATFRISGFARATVLDAKLTGAAASRSLTVRFETGIIDRPSSSVGNGTDYGVTTWAICAYDNKGVCP